jgi:hypothetical protein
MTQWMMSDMTWIIIGTLLVAVVLLTFSALLMKSHRSNYYGPEPRKVRQYIQWIDTEGNQIETPLDSLDDDFVKLLLTGYEGKLIVRARK